MFVYAFLCYEAKAVRRAGHSSKEPYKMYKEIKSPPPLCEEANVRPGL